MSEVLDALEADPDSGLSADEANQRRQKYGPNKLREVQTRTWTDILVDQLKSLIIGLLFVAAVVALFFHEVVESVAILGVIVINTLIGFFTELRAVRSMESLRELSGVSAQVFRDGELVEQPADNLVPGDVIKLNQGDLITADVRILESNNLQVDESALTGESVAVEKSNEPVERDASIAERHSMAYKGTVVTRGEATAVVVSTGMDTELGEITALVEEAEGESTPLEKRLESLGNKLVWLTLLVAASVTVSGILAGHEVFLMVESGIALAVAAVPEGLPVVATLALARGMWRMAEQNALINKLSAVETLGSTTVIMTDKTGTLTENDMVVRSIVTPDRTVTGEELDSTDGDQMSEDVQTALKIGLLCNNASRVETDDGESELTGDPMETALLEFGTRAGLTRESLLEFLPEEREEAFSSETNMMATFHRQCEDEFLVAVKGAPESVLESSDRIRMDGQERPITDGDVQTWQRKTRELADRGLRIIAVASRTASCSDEDPYQHLVFHGLVGLLDPPRRDVRGVIDTCQAAGIRIVMVTGDMAETARNIAQEVGIIEGADEGAQQKPNLDTFSQMSPDEKQRLRDTSVFSRVSPKQKLTLIDLHQDSGEITAMTGDGVNDAPALKKADIGIAMGERGTQVAREASDMVLMDDAFSSIVSAIRQGRIIFENIRKFVFYLLSCNVSEIMVVGLASVIGLPLPLLPLQILFLNLVTDVFPALALGFGEGDERIMERPPRPTDEPILGRSHWISIGLYGVVFTTSVLAALIIARTYLQLSDQQAVTISFLTLAFSQLWHVFNMREYGSSIFVNDITRNPYVWGALGLCVGLLLGAVYLPVLSTVLKVLPPGLSGWVLTVTASLIPLAYGQVVKSTGTTIADVTPEWMTRKDSP